MKNKIIIIASVVILIGIIGTIYLKQVKNDQNIEKNDNKVTNLKGNYDIIEAMKHIEATNTAEEINNILGFEGKKSIVSDDDFKWEFDDRNYITLKNAADLPVIEAKIYKRTIKNKNIQFPTNEELKEIIKDGITYNELVTKLGGIEGTLNGKSEFAIDYIWVDGNYQSLNATFNKETLKCSVATYTYREDD